MKFRQTLIIILIVLLYSCRPATQRWLDGMADYKEIHSKALSLQILKMKQGGDTTSISYKVRIYPSKASLENGSGTTTEFYYHMDSCFFIRSGRQQLSPVIVQAVNNGIANCYEYLVSFTVSKTIKAKQVELIYADRFIDGKQYALKLN